MVIIRVQNDEDDNIPSYLTNDDMNTNVKVKLCKMLDDDSFVDKITNDRKIVKQNNNYFNFATEKTNNESWYRQFRFNGTLAPPKQLRFNNNSIYCHNKKMTYIEQPTAINKRQEKSHTNKSTDKSESIRKKSKIR